MLSDKCSRTLAGTGRVGQRQAPQPPNLRHQPFWQSKGPQHGLDQLRFGQHPSSSRTERVCHIGRDIYFPARPKHALKLQFRFSTTFAPFFSFSLEPLINFSGFYKIKCEFMDDSFSCHSAVNSQRVHLCCDLVVIFAIVNQLDFNSKDSGIIATFFTFLFSYQFLA